MRQNFRIVEMDNKVFESFMRQNQVIIGEQEWRSGDRARLPPMWPGFDSRTRCHKWVECVVGSRPCSEGFPRVLRFSSSTKIKISKFQFNWELECHGFVSRKTKLIYLFILFILLYEVAW